MKFIYTYTIELEIQASKSDGTPSVADVDALKASFEKKVGEFIEFLDTAVTKITLTEAVPAIIELQASLPPEAHKGCGGLVTKGLGGS